MLNGDGNENGKKLIVLISEKTTFPRARHFFLHFFAAVCEASSLLRRLHCLLENEWENGVDWRIQIQFEYGMVGEL